MPEVHSETRGSSLETADPAAERAVLAGIFRHGNDVFADVEILLDAGSFVVDTHKVIYRCFEHLLRDKDDVKPDYPSILSAAHTLGLQEFLNKPENQQVLRGVMDMPVELSNIRRLAAKVSKLAIARQLVEELGLSATDVRDVTGDEAIDHILALAEGRVSEFCLRLSGSGTAAPKLIGDGIDEYLQWLEDNHTELCGISSGFARLDTAIGDGLEPGVHVIAARPKTGKSFLAMVVGLYVALKLGIPILYLDTEMNEKKCRNRLLANLSGVPIKVIKRGKYKFNDAQKAKVRQAAEQLKAARFTYKSILGQPFEETLAHMRRWVRKEVGLDEAGHARPCLIVYDYLKLMSADGLGRDMTEWQLIGFMMTALSNFAMRYELPVLAFGQLNRTGIDSDTTAAMSQSDRIIWFCSSFLIFRKLSPDEMADLPVGLSFTHCLIPLASREGPDEDNPIYVRANYAVGQLVEGPTRNEVSSGQYRPASEAEGFIVGSTDESVAFGAA